MRLTANAGVSVAPQLKFSNWNNVQLQGPVRTSFGNVGFLQAQCQTPIRSAEDPDGAQTIGGSCNQIQHAADSYHNYQKYLASWDALVNAGNGSTDMKSRPQGFGLMYENTTVIMNWVNVIDVASASAKAGRVVNNISMAVPHAGVSLAAYDAKNGILQPSVSPLDNMPEIN